jgi:spermidine synthase
MSFTLEELDRRPTPMGELTLLRRRSPSLGETDLYEIRLGGEFLMSSVINHSEIELARLALSELPEGDWDVLVGGLGLGCTARAVLEFPSVHRLVVAEYLEAVIDWHRRALVPLGEELTRDSRCTLVHADFFALFLPGGDGAEHRTPSPLYDAILVDIDHSPSALLDPSHASFYTEEGMARLTMHLRSRGVFALWSADPPDDRFLGILRGVFAEADCCEIRFANPLVSKEQTDYIYVCKKR